MAALTSVNLAPRQFQILVLEKLIVLSTSITLVFSFKFLLPMSQSPSPFDNDSPDATHNSLKRRIAALEEQNAELQGESRSNKRSCTNMDCYMYLTQLVSNSHGDIYVPAGRAIRRLVSLTDRVEDLVGEHDRRSALCDEDDQHTEE
jgi:hypothetical protein